MVPCVNSLDSSYPEYVEYSRVRLPQHEVHINTDKDFLVCCDCDDDCEDKSKCACWRLTVETTAASAEGKVDPNVGYEYRRLKDQVRTGIFECNSSCKCNKTCLNRVAQNPLRNRLQVFKTERRGWGIRTLCDIPAGAFICIYVGKLYNNNEANTQGNNFGDEYFADLDLMECVEKNKEGYESDYEDVDDLSSFEDEDEYDEDDEEEVVKEARERQKDKDVILFNVKPNEFAAAAAAGNNEDGNDKRTRRSERKAGDGESGNGQDEELKKKVSNSLVKSSWGTLFAGMSRNIYPLAAVQVVLRLLLCCSFQLWQQIM